MTPEERNLVTSLFDRLATLETSPRDPEADRLIRDGLRQAPNAPYALVQTSLVQDEALKRADARIRELEEQLGISPPEPQQPTGFLDNMRNSLWGPRDTTRTASVPTVRPAASQAPDARYDAPPPRYDASPQAQPAAQTSSPFSGGSFLGNAAATAAGVIGGSLLMNAIRSMTGNTTSTAHAAGNVTQFGGNTTPWSGGGGGGDLARQAGRDDIGRTPSRDEGNDSTRQNMVDSDNPDFDDVDTSDFDDGGGGSGGDE